MSALQTAEQNMERHLRRNSYPGRGLVVGRSDAAAAWLQIYWIMGRSEHSRNRRFVVEDSTLRTEPVDPSLVVDPSRIIYEAMLELPGVYLVSNGDQTRTVYETLLAGGTFDQALAQREREPDPPNYTARISAMLVPKDPLGPLALSILRVNRIDPQQTDRYTYRPAPPPAGLGYCLTTYMGDGQPLPPFEGEPLLLPCRGTAAEVLDTYWDALDTQNRISLAVKEIPATGSPGRILVRNRYADR